MSSGGAKELPVLHQSIKMLKFPDPWNLTVKLIFRSEHQGHAVLLELLPTRLQQSECFGVGEM